ncbi:ROK family protein [Corynebacterium sp. ES2794-CONJ1]|uniref:polyphosphate--glucose phosphotransferase n=1 Tax=unclassified Corynebacterium TaxID=2624378 RepID=UPI00216A2CE9|nr:MULTISPECIES: ROK family protein [unclassified Corynebacterium]MCS4489197.1 ROK family protein [Corynebacterium sp. ES2775-CONJ]MCS4491010.1 ROK family protein [Corynebacterium sp. ES2715-CONJ3]MCS4531109.1 ROK family protein [Corynebacterium sp. ES2730-CONJ]MCU9518476.1 ROK family protein [Corynebacterium sp. ES2794-CONJ1]
MSRIGFGIDVGGSGIKGARVDLDTGEFVGDRIKILTPKPATPQAVADTCNEILRIAGWDGPVGITLPSVIKNQFVLSAANIDPSWIGVDVRELFAHHLGEARLISVLNDADAAGLAEVTFGDEKASKGAVILLTFGTGIGSAFIVDGTLFPNTEVGHMIVEGREAESFASSSAKDRDEIGYTKWAARVSTVLKEYERIFNPTLFIAGGGISRKGDKWIPKLSNETPVIAAKLRNRAGIVGAALAVEHRLFP